MSLIKKKMIVLNNYINVANFNSSYGLLGNWAMTLNLYIGLACFDREDLCVPEKCNGNSCLFLT